MSVSVVVKSPTRFTEADLSSSEGNHLGFSEKVNDLTLSECTISWNICPVTGSVHSLMYKCLIPPECRLLEELSSLSSLRDPRLEGSGVVSREADVWLWQQ